MSHAPNASIGVCTCRATTDGLTKIPAPMIPPMTIIVAPTGRSRRAKDGPDAGSFEGFMANGYNRPIVKAEPRNEQPLGISIDLDEAYSRSTVLSGDNSCVM